MRGRSLLKESSTPNLCAFCAHRLGQARRPSHVQRRFLQSSRPVSKPPAEATAQREYVDDRNLQSNWGTLRPNRASGASSSIRSSTLDKGNGSSLSFGEPWGAPTSRGNERIPSRNAPGNMPMFSDLSPHERMARASILNKGNNGSSSSTGEALGAPASRGKSAVSSQNTPSSPPIFDDLLPHERKARELMLAKYKTAPPAKPNPPRENTTRVSNREPSSARRSNMGRRDNATFADEKPGYHGSTTEASPRLERKPGFTIRKPFSRDNFRSTRTEYNPEHKSIPSRQGQQDPNWDQLRKRNERVMPERDSWVENAKANIFSARTLDTDESPRTTVYRPLVKERADSAPRYTAPERSWSGQVEPSHTRPPPDMQRESREAKKPFEAYTPAPERREKKTRSRSEAQVVYPDYDNSQRGKKSRDKSKRRQHFDLGEGAEEQNDAALARAELKRKRKAEKAAEKAAAPTPIFLPEYISVSNLAVALKVRLEDFIYKMEELGFEETNHDHIMNAENSGLIAMEYNFDPIIDRGATEDLKAREPAEDPTSLPPRPPVVTIMGHVDHGKTTLLDWLRKSSVAATEHGGITQHIGAFSVRMPGGKVITFLDTPGHAAFLSMRQRGANVTDIVILVVAADDSVKPQTIEAINHAKAAKVPIVVAINKIDKEGANIDRVKQDLARHGVEVEDYGGDTQVVCVSGKTGQGMDDLEDAAVTLSEILDMRAEKDGPAEGWVLEASIKSMGKVATVLVRRGTMRPGDFIVAGQTWARIRCLRNEAGIEIEEAGPGTPVEIDGWREQPLAGDEVLQAPDESKAKSVIEYRLEAQEREKMAEDMEAINEFRKGEQGKREREKSEAEAAKAAAKSGENMEVTDNNAKSGGPKQVYIIIKGDVSGSVEAVIDSVSAIGNQEVQPHILRSGVGQIAEFDIEHAATAHGILLNFNTTIEPQIARLAEEKKVKIIDQNIIYRLVDEVKAELSKYLAPTITQRVLGEAEIAQIFDITVKGRKQKPVAGCKVRNGTIMKNEKVRVMRGGEKIFDGSLESLKNAKKDAMEMKKGTECGLGFADWNDFRVGDQVQSYEQIEEKRYL